MTRYCKSCGSISKTQIPLFIASTRETAGLEALLNLTKTRIAQGLVIEGKSGQGVHLSEE